MVVLLMALLAVVAGARVLGSRGADRSDSARAEAEAALEAKRRADGFVNQLTIVNMLDVRIMVNVADVDPAQWGRTPPDDEPPAGLQAEVVDPQRVSGTVRLRPLRIVDGGGTATFTLAISNDGAPGDRTPSRVPIGVVSTRSNALEFCGDECFDGYGWFDWVDAPEPALDTFRRCVVDERVIGSYVDRTGVRRDVTALFQCDATRFESTLIIHS
jgi:hypothetical protein